MAIFVSVAAPIAKDQSFCVGEGLFNSAEFALFDMDLPWSVVDVWVQDMGSFVCEML